MVRELSERELVEACKRGDREAFRALFETHKDKVYSVALRYSGDAAAAMDIAQETFLKLFSRIADFRGDSGIETWLYRLVVNSCLDQKRKSWRMLPLADEIAGLLRAPGRNAADELLQAELRSEVQKAIAKLVPELRIVIILRYTEGLSYDGIAEVLACAPGTVASRLNRAHAVLERRLSHLNGKGGRHA
jgi:RNA polymerase sigma-70 factor (ECF subfamily)